MLRRTIVLFFIAIAVSASSQSGPYENEEFSFLADFKEGIVLIPIDRIEGGIMQNSLESSQKEESNLAIFNALRSSTISDYYFFYKENISQVENRQLNGVLLDGSLQSVALSVIADKPIFVITFLDPGHIPFPEVRTYKKTKKGLKCDIRNLGSGPYAKRESEDHLRLIRVEYKKTRWETEELANAKLSELLESETKAYRILLENETDSEYFRYRPSVDGEMFNRDFGRFPVMELRRIEAHHLIYSDTKYFYFHPKIEARIYPELSTWDTMERAIAEIERQVDKRLVKYQSVLEARARIEANK
ncbi:MAG: hypothetical protein ACI84C_000600 [Flavobacteriales bacterium]|jgi:hypothetical protein